MYSRTMGNTSSSRDRHAEESVDFGALTPQGWIYSSQPDWNQTIVAQLIVQRKLAPFYRPLEDYEQDWNDDQILAARKKVSSTESHGDEGLHKEGASGATGPPLQSATSALKHASSKSSSKSHQPPRDIPRNFEAQVYRGAVECPICFLYYPPNINQTRCCDQAICTECFVHIKRADPTTTHVVSEPACCPYCMQPNFGVTYAPPNWRAGIGGESNPRLDSLAQASGPANSVEISTPEGKRRRRSISHTSGEVVTIDQIRPDWEVKLNQVRAAVARRANRRIIMRQVGDQLIPIGVSRGAVITLSPGTEGASSDDSSGGSGSRRSRRRERRGEYAQFMGMHGQDLEELMIMEAMRLSMVEEEERQRRLEEERNQRGVAGSQQAEPSDPAPLSSSHQPSASAQMANDIETISSSVPVTASLHFPLPGRPNSTLFTPSSSSSSSSASRNHSRSRLPRDTSALGEVRSASLPRDAPSVRPPTSAPSALSALIDASAVLSDEEENRNSDSPGTPASHPESDMVLHEQLVQSDGHEIDTPKVSRSTSTPSGRSSLNEGSINLDPEVASEPQTSQASQASSNLRVPIPQRRTTSSSTLLTSRSINSEAAEEYDFLPSTPQSSVLSEMSARVPLVSVNSEETDRDGDSHSYSDSTHRGDVGLLVLENSMTAS